MVITYNAVDRSFLIPAHTEFTEYKIEFCVSKLDEMIKSVNKPNIAIDRTTETLFYSNELEVSISANFIDNAQRLEFREFFSSVGGGEFFNVDIDGTIAVPSLNLYGNCIYMGSEMVAMRNTESTAAQTRYEIAIKFRVLS